MDRDADGEDSGASESDGMVHEETELADLDPNAEEQAQRVERQLRRLRREMQA